MSKSETTPPDISAVWRDWATQSERQWNEFFNEMMGTDEFSQSLGRNLDVFLHFQKTMSEAMGPYLTALNVPTRTDVLTLGDRLHAIENRLAAIEANLSVLQASLAKGASDQPSPKPARTKRAATRPAVRPATPDTD